MKSIKKIEALSLAKTFGLIIGGVYLGVVIIVVTLGSLFIDDPNFERLDMLGFGSTIIATFLLAVIIGAVGFVIGLLFAWLYNISAPIFGGIHIELAEVEDHLSVFERRFKRKLAQSAPIQPQPIQYQQPQSAQPDYNQPVKRGRGRPRKYPQPTYQAQTPPVTAPPQPQPVTQQSQPTPLPSEESIIGSEIPQQEVNQVIQNEGMNFQAGPKPESEEENRDTFSAYE